MFKKAILIFCLALSFITFSCSKDKEPDNTPHIPALTQTMWEGSEEAYEGNELVRSIHTIFVFTNGESMDYITNSSDDSYQDKSTFKYFAGNRILRIGDNDYYALEASNDYMMLQKFSGRYKYILRLRKR